MNRQIELLKDLKLFLDYLKNKDYRFKELEKYTLSSSNKPIVPREDSSMRSDFFDEDVNILLKGFDDESWTKIEDEYRKVGKFYRKLSTQFGLTRYGYSLEFKEY